MRDVFIHYHEASSIQKIILFGGTFNPIHEGHILLMCEAFKKIFPQKIILIPNGLSPSKEKKQMASVNDRLQMCKLAIRQYPFIEVDDYELRITNPSYTIDTLHYVKRKFFNVQLYLLMGTDVFLKFDTWYKWEQYAKLVILLVGSRYKGDEKNLERQQKYLSQFGIQSKILHNKITQESSTHIRKMIKTGKYKKLLNYQDIINFKVFNYIFQQKLYR